MTEYFSWILGFAWPIFGTGRVTPSLLANARRVLIFGSVGGTRDRDLAGLVRQMRFWAPESRCSWMERNCPAAGPLLIRLPRAALTTNATFYTSGVYIQAGQIS